MAPSTFFLGSGTAPFWGQLWERLFGVVRFFNYRTWKRMWVKSLWPLKNLQHLIAGIPTFVNLTFLGILDAVGLLNSPDERVLNFRQGSARDSFQTC